MLQLVRYEIRSQRKRFGIIAIMIAIALTCFMIVDAFVGYANNRVALEAKPLAGADIVLDSSRSRDNNSTETIKNIVGDKGVISQRVQLNTNITSPQDSRLVQLLGVDSIYPLYGTINIKPVAGRTFTFGEGVAVDQKTYDMLEGDVITIGDITLNVDGIIEENPGLSLNLFTQGRQVIMPLSRIEETGLLRLGSRSEYQYLIKVNNPEGSDELITALRANTALTQQRDVDDYQGRVSQVGDLLDELGIYLLLVIFCAFLLVAVTSMLSIDEYLYRRLKTISIMQILGARKGQLIGFYAILCIVMILLSSLVAFGISTLIAQQIQSISLLSGFVLSSSAIRQGIGVCIILTSIAWVLPLLKIILRPPLAGLAESSINLSTNAEKIRGTSVLVIGILVVLRIIGESWSNTFMLGGIIATGYTIIRGLIRGLLAIGSRISHKISGRFILFDAIRSTTRPGNTSVLIASTLIVALSTTLLLVQFGGSFIERLQFSNNNQPNRFVVNIPKDDISKIRDVGITDPAYNIVLGRIMAINNISLQNHLAAKRDSSNGGTRGEGNEGGGEGRFTREFNITTTVLAQQDTVAGDRQVPKGGVSLDREFAKDLGVNMGDTIRFNIAGKEFDVVVTGLRKTNRTNFSPFFFIQLNAEQFSDAPMTYFLTLQVSEQDKNIRRQQIASILTPGVAFIEIDTIIASLRTISSRIIEVVSILLAIILVFACFTTIVCVENMRYAKAFKMRLYNILGATTKETRLSIIYEYGYILSIAIVASIAIGWGIAGYFIGISEFLSWSWIASLQGIGVIIAILVINSIVIARTMKR